MARLRGELNFLLARSPMISTELFSCCFGDTLVIIGYVGLSISVKSQLFSIGSLSLFWLSTDFKSEFLLPIRDPLRSASPNIEFLMFIKVCFFEATSSSLIFNNTGGC